MGVEPGDNAGKNIEQANRGWQPVELPFRVSVGVETETKNVEVMS